MRTSLTARARARYLVSFFGAAVPLASLLPGDARAEEPRLSSEPVTMREPGDEVDVVDAFDDRDPFDIHIGLGFGFEAKRASIETHGQGGRHFGETVARLVPHVETGLYKDLALTGTFPIVLSDSRSLNVSNHGAGGLLTSNGQSIASLPFAAPDRSGPEYLALGAEWGPLNQARNPHFPTFMFGAEVRLPLGETMRACNDTPVTGELKCAHPGDKNRDGKRDAGEPADVTDPLAPGTTRGTVGIEVYANVSRRIRYLEPWFGVRGLFEAPVGTSALKAAGAEAPPVELGGAAGLMVIPWENRERFGRVTFDLRVDASVRTSGTDFTELFDALGSSDSAAVRAASASGVTHVAAFPEGNLGATAIWQSSRYVKLSFGIGVGYAGNHAVAEAGKSSVTAPPVVSQADLSVSDSFRLALSARGVVMF